MVHTGRQVLQQRSDDELLPFCGCVGMVFKLEFIVSRGAHERTRRAVKLLQLYILYLCVLVWSTRYNIAPASKLIICSVCVCVRQHLVLIRNYMTAQQRRQPRRRRRLRAHGRDTQRAKVVMVVIYTGCAARRGNETISTRNPCTQTRPRVLQLLPHFPFASRARNDYDLSGGVCSLVCVSCLGHKYHPPAPQKYGHHHISVSP